MSLAVLPRVVLSDLNVLGRRGVRSVCWSACCRWVMTHFLWDLPVLRGIQQGTLGGFVSGVATLGVLLLHSVFALVRQLVPLVILFLFPLAGRAGLGGQGGESVFLVLVGRCGLDKQPTSVGGQGSSGLSGLSGLEG